MTDLANEIAEQFRRARFGEVEFEVAVATTQSLVRVEIARLTRERDGARATNAKLNRRCQSAEAGLAARLESGRSFGRVLANSAAEMYREQADALRRDVGLLREACERAKAMCGDALMGGASKGQAIVSKGYARTIIAEITEALSATAGHDEGRRSGASAPLGVSQPGAAAQGTTTSTSGANIAAAQETGATAPAVRPDEPPRAVSSTREPAPLAAPTAEPEHVALPLTPLCEAHDFNGGGWCVNCGATR